jgi:hypothetical protein
MEYFTLMVLFQKKTIGNSFVGMHFSRDLSMVVNDFKEVLEVSR